MAVVIKTLKTVRNHWKKSTFAALCLFYGYNYARAHFETQSLMRVYCERAAKFGAEPLIPSKEPRTVTVILNPSANKRKALDEFEQYCAPILNLAGICVNVVKTESEGHARTLINEINNTDAILVAGGDGTFSEVITGLLRRTQENTTGLIPLGVVPLGRTNSVSQTLFPDTGTKVAKVKSIAEAAMAVVEEVVKPLDVLKIQLLDEDPESDKKPIYAASGIKWGAYRDAECKKDSYWVYGSFRKYATYVFNGYKSTLTWHCKAGVDYSPPCEGCSNCCKPQFTRNKKSWFSGFKKEPANTFRNVDNPQCKITRHCDISTVDLNLKVADQDNVPKVTLNIGPSTVGYFDFVSQGCGSERGKDRRYDQTIEARTVEIQPKINSEERWFSIDNETYELKPIRVTLLPKLLNVFCSKSRRQTEPAL